MLSATLAGLALVMLLLVLVLGTSVARQARHGSADTTGKTVGSTCGVVANLAVGFLLLALQVLLATGLLQTLCWTGMLAWE
jgi:hypothetical protein